MPTSSDSSALSIDILEQVGALHREATPGPWAAGAVYHDSPYTRVPFQYVEASSGWAKSGMVNRSTVAEISHWTDRVNPESDARLIALSRNSLPEVIALALAAQGLVSLIEIIDSGQTVIPFGQEGATIDAAIARQREALSSLLRVFSNDLPPAAPAEGRE